MKKLYLMDKVKVKHNSKKMYFDNLEIKECSSGSVTVFLFIVTLFFSFLKKINYCCLLSAVKATS